jgi:rhodanese-related sulfurtransferase
MQNNRRKFFGTLLAGSAAANLLADVPEPERVSKMRPQGNEIFFLEYPGILSLKQIENIRAAWKAALGDTAPRVVVLEHGMRVKIASTGMTSEPSEIKEP